MSIESLGSQAFSIDASASSLPASLLQPEGSYGPAFLAPKNYFVLKDYNYSDLYVLFVGHLSDRIQDGKPFEKPWSKNTQLKSAEVEAMLATLGERGDVVEKSGHALMPGSMTTDSDVARACAEMLATPPTPKS